MFSKQFNFSLKKLFCCFFPHTNLRTNYPFCLFLLNLRFYTCFQIIYLVCFPSVSFIFTNPIQQKIQLTHTFITRNSAEIKKTHQQTLVLLRQDIGRELFRNIGGNLNGYFQIHKCSSGKLSKVCGMLVAFTFLVRLTFCVLTEFLSKDPLERQ